MTSGRLPSRCLFPDARRATRLPPCGGEPRNSHALRSLNDRSSREPFEAPGPNHQKIATDGPRGRRDILAMQALQPLSKSYDGWSTGAMRPSGLVLTLNEILWFQRRNVVELGSGVSTLFIARLLAERVPEGQLLSIEHNEDWAALVDDRLNREKLTGVARVIHVPLRPTERTLDSAPGAWYDEARLRADLTGKIDLLLVDGPPAYGKASPTSRYPAIPALSSEFADSFSIILGRCHSFRRATGCARLGESARTSVHNRQDRRKYRRCPTVAASHIVTDPTA